MRMILGFLQIIFIFSILHFLYLYERRNMDFKLSELSEIDLLKLHASIIKELKYRKVVRTQNNPVGDYTEWLISNTLNLKLTKNSKAGYDGIDKKGTKYQIKGRRITPDNLSRQLSAIRNLDQNKFDFLIGVIFDENYGVINAIQIPYAVVVEYATYRKHVNGHILHVRGKVLNDSRIINIKNIILNN
jgi:hypothetical protein